MVIKTSIIIAASIVLMILFFEPQTILAQENHVIINEIQLAGKTATDEFVELYNSTNQPINLAGWRLAKKTQSGNLYNLVTTFPEIFLQPQAYLVVAHKDFQADFNADVYYSTTSSLADNNTLILFSDAGKTAVDKVGLGSASDFETTPALNPTDNQSINRSAFQDTDNNSLDFTVSSAATPKKENQIAGSQQTADNNQQNNTTNTDNNSTANSQPNNSQTYSNQIVVNELLPNPVGSDEENEWIELFNSSNFEVDLNGWQLADNSGKKFTVSKNKFSITTIAPGGFFVIKRTASKIALNNDNDLIKLYQPNDNLLFSVSYKEEAQEGLAYARDDKTNSWFWTTSPTPSASNLIKEPQDKVEDDGEVAAEPETNESANKNEIEKNSETADKNVIYSNAIIFNEILPNPLGPDEENEWLELKNISDENIDLNNWLVADASRQYQINKKDYPNTIIKATGYFLISRKQSGLALNNSGEEKIRLYQPNKNLLEEVGYQGSVPENVSYARDEDDAWFWTSQNTPGQKNTIVLTKKEPTSTANAEKTTIKTAVAAKTSANGRTQVEGVVLVEPGIFGVTYFYLEGLQIYCYKKDFPALQIGDKIVATGEITQANNEKRLKIKDRNDIKLVSRGNQPHVLSRTAEEISEEDVGKLVKIAGQVLEEKSNKIYLADDSGEFTVTIKPNAKINKEIFIKGDNLVVQGIVSYSSDSLTILPRAEQDITLEKKVLGLEENKNDVFQRRNPNRIRDYLLLALIAALAVIIIILFRKREDIRIWLAEKKELLKKIKETINKS